MTERLHLVKGDLTRLEVDVIVNAANSSLLGGGGVDGAIHRAAGPELAVFCRTLGGAKTGQVKLSPAFRLPVKAIAHAVGPVWNGGHHGEAEALERCYREAIRLSVERGFESVAFPAISTGIYGFPFERATTLALGVVREALERHPSLQVTLCFFTEADFRTAQRLAEASR